MRTGDVVAVTGGWKVSKSKRHVVQSIIRPAGIPLEERPPVPDQATLWADAIEMHRVKTERKEAARAAKRAEEERKLEAEGGRKGKRKGKSVIEKVRIEEGRESLAESGHA